MRKGQDVGAGPGSQSATPQVALEHQRVVAGERLGGHPGDSAVAQVQALQDWQVQDTLGPFGDSSAAEVQVAQGVEATQIQARDTVVLQVQGFKSRQAAQALLEGRDDAQLVVGKIQLAQGGEVVQGRRQLCQVAGTEVQVFNGVECAEKVIQRLNGNPGAAQVDLFDMGERGRRQPGQVAQYAPRQVQCGGRQVGARRHARRRKPRPQAFTPTVQEPLGGALAVKDIHLPAVNPQLPGRPLLQVPAQGELFVEYLVSAGQYLFSGQTLLPELRDNVYAKPPAHVFQTIHHALTVTPHQGLLIEQVSRIAPHVFIHRHEFPAVKRGPPQVQAAPQAFMPDEHRRGHRTDVCSPQVEPLKVLK